MPSYPKEEKEGPLAQPLDTRVELDLQLTCINTAPPPSHPPWPLSFHTFAHTRMALLLFLLLKSTHLSRPRSNHPSLRRQTCLENPLLCLLQPATLVPTAGPKGHNWIQVVGMCPAVC